MELHADTWLKTEMSNWGAEVIMTPGQYSTAADQARSLLSLSRETQMNLGHLFQPSCARSWWNTVSQMRTFNS